MNNTVDFGSCYIKKLSREFTGKNAPMIAAYARIKSRLFSKLISRHVGRSVKHNYLMSHIELLYNSGMYYSPGMRAAIKDSIAQDCIEKEPPAKPSILSKFLNLFGIDVENNRHKSQPLISPPNKLQAVFALRDLQPSNNLFELLETLIYGTEEEIMQYYNFETYEKHCIVSDAIVDFLPSVFEKVLLKYVGGE